MKIILLLFAIVMIFLQASNFRDGILLYKDGNFTAAKNSFELAIQKDKSMQAQFMLGKMYLLGEGVLPQRKKAINYLKFSVMNGNLRAKCYLAEAYLENNTNIDKAGELLNNGAQRNLKECKKTSEIYNTIIEKKVKK